MERTDYLVVGSGLTGAVIARVLGDAGRDVLVLDRREHAGGNVHDRLDASGIRVHSYGPHYFRTNSGEIWNFVRRFSNFYPYEACLQSLVDGRLERWPINESYLREHVGEDWQPEFTGQPGNFEEACLSMMPRLVYDKFIKGYTEKQWGLAPRLLSAELARRVEIRPDHDPRLMQHLHQGLPAEGYATLMRNMLAGIPVRLGCDYLAQREAFAFRKKLIFTGPIDAYFDFDLGKLKYRGQQRTHVFLPAISQYQPCGQVNNPQPENGPHIRTLEWKHMMPPTELTSIAGTLITREVPHTPADPDGYEYPFPDAVNARLYKQYRQRAEVTDKVLICGRLGEYRYYDMDQAIARALTLARRLLAEI